MVQIESPLKFKIIGEDKENIFRFASNEPSLNMSSNSERSIDDLQVSFKQLGASFKFDDGECSEDDVEGFSLIE